MKILFLAENFPPETNAAATRVFERAVYWIKAGHQVTIITSAPNFPLGVLFDGYQNRWYQIENMSGIKVVRVKTFISENIGVFFRSLDFFSFGIMGFIAGCLQNKPDLIAATSPQFFAAVVGWAISTCRRLPFVFELGDLWPTSVSAVGAVKKNFILNLFEKFELFLYRHSTRVAALTYSYKTNLIRRGVRPDQIDVVLNGVDLPRYAPQTPNNKLLQELGLKNKFVIGYVGTHGMAHGLGNVLTTAKILEEEKNIQFLFVGAGAEREWLINTVKKNDISNVIFLPMQPKEKMPAIWSLCNVALVHLKNHPAFADVIPSKIFEAMAMGLPIVLAAPDGEANNIISKHNAGIWVPPENPNILAKEVKKLAEDEPLYCQLASNSFAAAASHSRVVQAEEMITVFKKALYQTEAGIKSDA